MNATDLSKMMKESQNNIRRVLLREQEAALERRIHWLAKPKGKTWIARCPLSRRSCRCPPTIASLR